MSKRQYKRLLQEKKIVILSTKVINQGKRDEIVKHRLAPIQYVKSSWR